MWKSREISTVCCSRLIFRSPTTSHYGEVERRPVSCRNGYIEIYMNRYFWLCQIRFGPWAIHTFSLNNNDETAVKSVQILLENFHWEQHCHDCWRFDMKAIYHWTSSQGGPWIANQTGNCMIYLTVLERSYIRILFLFYMLFSSLKL